MREKRDELAPQVENLQLIVDGMQKGKNLESIARLYRSKLALTRERASLLRLHKETKSEDFTCEVSTGYYMEPRCDGRIDPISLQPIARGLCAEGICYSYASIKRLFEVQYEEKQHLHDPICRAVDPNDFKTLFLLELITRNTLWDLLRRYPASSRRRASHPDRRFQLERVDRVMQLLWNPEPPPD